MELVYSNLQKFTLPFIYICWSKGLVSQHLELQHLPTKTFLILSNKLIDKIKVNKKNCNESIRLTDCSRNLFINSTVYTLNNNHGCWLCFQQLLDSIALSHQNALFSLILTVCVCGKLSQWKDFSRSLALVLQFPNTQTVITAATIPEIPKWFHLCFRQQRYYFCTMPLQGSITVKDASWLLR